MSHNTLIHRIVRPAVRLAARTRLTPNHVTTVRLITGLAAAACFAIGQLAVGAALFLISMLLDRADGELARQTARTSLNGHRYDLASDCIATVAAFLGLGVGLVSAVGPLSAWLGLLAGMGVCALFFQLNVLKTVPVCSCELFDGRITVDPDDAMVAAPVLIWCGLTWPMLIAAGVVTPFIAIGVALLSRRPQPAGDTESPRPQPAKSQ